MVVGLILYMDVELFINGNVYCLEMHHCTKKRDVEERYGAKMFCLSKAMFRQ